MNRSFRVLVVSMLLAVGLSGTAHAAVGPELDPGSIAAGVTVLAVGGLYLIERFKRR